MKSKKGGKWLDDKFVKRARKERKRRFELKAYYRAGQSILETLDDYFEGGIGINFIPSKIQIALPKRVQYRKSKVVWYAKILLKDLEDSGLIEKVVHRTHRYSEVKVKYDRKRKCFRYVTVHRYIDVKLK